MEHERYYALMMEALDEELVAADRVVLDLHLTDCAACRREWRTLVAIDRLLHQALILSPAAGFTQRTLARLPNRRYRIWLMGLMYSLLLLSGLAPLLAGAWLTQRVIPVLLDPNLLWGVWQTLATMGQVLATVLNALLLGLGQVLVEESAVTGMLLIMAGTIFLWSGLYRRWSVIGNQ
jgi:anti-sigma factor RsiW